MISLLIAQPFPCGANIKRLPSKRMDRELVSQNYQTVDELSRDKETYVFKLIAWFFALLVFPAVLSLLYVALNPDAFMTDIAPKIDLSTWQQGDRP